jgi:hypothetical protein
MHRVLRLPLEFRAKHLVRELFLLIRHRIVQVLKGRNQLLQMLRMLLGDLLVELHVLHSAHRLEITGTLHPRPVHLAGVLAHHLRELIPLRTLCWGDTELSVQLFDPLLDPFRRVSAGCGMSANGDCAAAGRAPSGAADARAGED